MIAAADIRLNRPGLREGQLDLAPAIRITKPLMHWHTN